MDTRGALFMAAVLCACLECGAHAQTANVGIHLTPAGLVVAPVELHGASTRHFVIDTGATTTMLDARFATTLGLAPTHTLPILTASGTSSAPAAAVAGLNLGSMRIGRLTVSWVPLDRLRAEDARVTGVIGQDVLSRNTVTIDYTRRRLQVASGPCSAGDVRASIERVEGRPAIRARVQRTGGTREVRLVIDSGANALVLFDKEAEGSVRSGGIRLATHTGEAPASIIPRARVTIAGVAFEGPAVMISPAGPRWENGLLPAFWFSRVCLDGPRATAVLTR